MANASQIGVVPKLGIFCLIICAVVERVHGGDQQSTSQPQASSQQARERSDSCAPTKKPKKVWTNEDMSEVKNSPVSEVGKLNTSSAERSGSRQSAVPTSQAVASYRKQLAALETQQASIEKQIADLKNFNRGEAGHDTGLQLNKRYSTEPIDDQIRKLEAKHKQIGEQIDALFAAARKKGMEPGQLR